MEQKNIINELFGNYKTLNFALVNRYTKQLQKKLNKRQSANAIYFKGEIKLNYIDFLKDKTLNQSPESVESVFEDIAHRTCGLPNWSNPGTMINIIPPVNLVALSASNTIRGFNANFAQDTYAGFLITSELEVSKYISDLIGWDWQQSVGVFTFGGKGTNLYATKIALAKCDADSGHFGCERNKYFVLTSSTSHPCHYEVCDWLGIGRECCIEIPCQENGEIDLEKMQNVINVELGKGKIFLGCNLNGGSTNELYMDPIKKISKLINQISEQHHLTYRPHIHVDSVIGWVFLFFNQYDFEKNPLKIAKDDLIKIQAANKLASDFKYADSIGIDFHKTGFCPYTSSLFLCKYRKDFNSIAPGHEQSLNGMEYGDYNPYHTTLELTRSSEGAISALCSLKTLGISGFQQVYARMIGAANYFRKKISKEANICLLNQESCWLASLFIIKPPRYTNLTLSDILKLAPEEINDIKQYNVNFAKFIQAKARNSKCNFVFTSSRSHVVPGTDISLGTLKAYPMSIFLTKKIAANIVADITKCIKEFSVLSGDSFKNEQSIADDMVYRRKVINESKK